MAVYSTWLTVIIQKRSRMNRTALPPHWFSAEVLVVVAENLKHALHVEDGPPGFGRGRGRHGYHLRGTNGNGCTCTASLEGRLHRTGGGQTSSSCGLSQLDGELGSQPQVHHWIILCIHVHTAPCNSILECYTTLF